MARRLGADLNELRLQDNISGSEIVLFYRMPTTEEMNSYSNGMVQRKGNKIKKQLGEMRQKYGARILSGIGDKSFEKKVGDKWVPIHSETSSKLYDKDWKKQVQEMAPDIIETLAIHVFETSVQLAADDEDAEGN